MSPSQAEIGWNNFDYDVKMWILRQCNTLPVCHVPPPWHGMSSEQQLEIITWIRIFKKTGDALVSAMGIR